MGTLLAGLANPTDPKQHEPQVSKVTLPDPSGTCGVIGSNPTRSKSNPTGPNPPEQHLQG